MLLYAREEGRVNSIEALASLEIAIEASGHHLQVQVDSDCSSGLSARNYRISLRRMNVSRKMAVVDAIHRLLSQKIDASVSTLQGLTESRNTASKSTAGDKHETGRAMMEAEIGRAEQQLQKAKMLRNELKNLPWSIQNLAVPGALIQTNHGEFLISVGLGKIEVDSEVCFALSGGSPLGQALMGRKEGDHVSFQGREYQLLSIQ